MDHHVKHQHKVANYVYKTWQKIEGTIELFSLQDKWPILPIITYIFLKAGMKFFWKKGPNLKIRNKLFYSSPHS